MKILFLIGISLGSLLMADFSYNDSGAAKAFKDLDCEFEDCSQKEPKVKIIEKVVYKPRPVLVEKMRTPKQEVSTSDITFSKAFFDVHTNTQAPILDYITYTKRGSFDVNSFADTVSKIKENKIDVYIYGNIMVPDSITTKQVYMYVGEKYHYNYYGYWVKDITYNGTSKQNADYFLAKVKADNKGRHYVAYKIHIYLDVPSKIKPAEKNVAPNTYFFKMAPKVRAYKTKFVPVQIYIENE